MNSQQTAEPNGGSNLRNIMKKIETTNSFLCSRGTQFGPVAILWSVHRGQPKILRILLSKSGLSARHAVKSLFPDSVSSSCAEIDVIAARIADFLSGKDIRFSLDVARLDLCSAFQQEVLRAEHGIPRGRVSTYQRIAGHLGNARGARAVGTALAHNPFPIIVPCHRAIRSDGTLGGFQGGIEMKRALLEMEGVSVNGLNRVASARMFY
ncbi:MAG: methylated-DNA--[protein]-cysteine S-methyltransferase [Nitrospirota bacterium]